MITFDLFIIQNFSDTTTKMFTKKQNKTKTIQIKQIETKKKKKIIFSINDHYTSFIVYKKEMTTSHVN